MKSMLTVSFGLATGSNVASFLTEVGVLGADPTLMLLISVAVDEDVDTADVLERLFNERFKPGNAVRDISFV
jgi:hypothetical protein